MAYTFAPNMGNIVNASGLSEEDRSRMGRLLNVWSERLANNQIRRDFYEMRVNPESIGVALSDELVNCMKVACGWPALTVNMPAERSMFDGFTFESGLVSDQLNEIMRYNRINAKYLNGCQSELMHGLVNWTLFRQGSKVRIMLHSAETSACVWNGLEDRIDYGFAIVENAPFSNIAYEYAPTVVNLYTDTATVVLTRSYGSWEWSAEYKPHNLGRPTMEAMAYLPTLSKPLGQSRITKAVMSITLNKLRNDIRAEVAAEWAATPQKYLLGASDEAFNQSRVEQYLGGMFVTTKDEDGDVPKFGQLSQASMQPLVDYSRMLASAFASETSLPLHSLGVITDNPTSAEAMQMSERDLVQVVHKMNECNGEALRNVALMAMAMGKGVGVPIEELTDDEKTVMVDWRDPAMPNLSSVADAWVKLASAQPWIGETSAFLEGVGIGRSKRAQMLSEKRVAQGRSFLTGAANGNDTSVDDTSLLGNAVAGAAAGARVRVAGVAGGDGGEGNGSIVS